MQCRLNLLLVTIQGDLSLHGDLQTWHSSFGWDRPSSRRWSRPSPARKGLPKCSLGIESRTPLARHEPGFRSYRSGRPTRCMSQYPEMKRHDAPGAIDLSPGSIGSYPKVLQNIDIVNIALYSKRCWPGREKPNKSLELSPKVVSWLEGMSFVRFASRW